MLTTALAPSPQYRRPRLVPRSPGARPTGQAGV